jgi:tetratricopeptide (TPR) repeat protein
LATLKKLGERESDAARREEAVEAFREALMEYTRARVPLDWAMIPNNFGNALKTLGERESGTAQLEEAVTSYREALQENTRARMPLEWAMTQNNLATALHPPPPARHPGAETRSISRQGPNAVENPRYAEAERSVYINATQNFAPVPSP